MVKEIKVQSAIENITQTDTRITNPVAVILERNIDASKKWAFPSWHVFSIDTGKDVNASEQRVTEHEGWRSQTLLLGRFKTESVQRWF